MNHPPKNHCGKEGASIEESRHESFSVAPDKPYPAGSSSNDSPLIDAMIDKVVLGKEPAGPPSRDLARPVFFESGPRPKAAVDVRTITHAVGPGAFRIVPIDTVPSTEDPPLCTVDVQETVNDSPLSIATASVSSDEPDVVLPAMLVGDEELGDSAHWDIPKAKEIDPSQLSSTDIFRQRAIFTIIVAAVLVAVGAILGATLGKREPEAAYQKLSFADFRNSYLPTDSLQRAIEDPQSPQGQALAWVEEEAAEFPRVAWQMLQRYALAAVYFSLRGDGLNGTKWLTSTDECSWDSFFNSTSRTYAHQSACDSRDRYVVLALSNQNLTGTIPPEIGLLTSLEMLELNGNYLVGSIPPAFSKLSNLNRLLLDSNRLTGTIPSEVGLLEHLVEVNVGDNGLTGPLPSEIGLLPMLKTLRLARNQLSGPIPTELGLLPVIEYFYFSSNHFSGSIPVEVTQLKSLVEIRFCVNQLTGTIPTEIALLQNLESISLVVNSDLRGSIPSEMGSLSSLTSLALEATGITGTIPSEL
jgi:hypothetical protein